MDDSVSMAGTGALNSSRGERMTDFAVVKLEALLQFITRDEIESTLAALPQEGRYALQDRTLLIFLYNTGARVQETADLRATDIHFDPSPRVHLHGKGDKWRVCPL